MNGGDVLTWWAALCAVAGINVLAWALSAAALLRRDGALPHDERRWRRWQLLLGAGYVAGCAWRSLFPVFDVPRLVVVDSALSSILIGRTVATLAELCFAAQWALLLRAFADRTDHRFGLVVARALLPMIVVAEACSWLSVLTTANLGHALEESIWGACALLVAASLMSMRLRCRGPSRTLVLVTGVAAVAYALFMFAVDVPMYWARWVADEALARPYLGLADGFFDAATRRVVSHQWQDWRNEVVWMSLYFSVAVWLSIALAHVPLMPRMSPRTRPRSVRQAARVLQ
jgi:hypothetical protein